MTISVVKVLRSVRDLEFADGGDDLAVELELLSLSIEKGVVTTNEEVGYSLYSIYNNHLKTISRGFPPAPGKKRHPKRDR